MFGIVVVVVKKRKQRNGKRARRPSFLIVAANGVPMFNPAFVSDEVRKYPDKPITLTVQQIGRASCRERV